MFNKKRRVQKSVNKNLQKVMQRQALDNQTRGGAGRLSSRFGTVTHMEIQMEFVSPQGHSLSAEKRDFQLSDVVDFSAPCQGRCGNGRMDLEGKISSMVNAKLPYSETKGICQEILYAGSKDVCGCELRCKIKIDYLD